MRNVRAQKNHIAGAKKFNIVTYNSFAGATDNINQFTFRMKMKGGIKIGHIPFENNQALLGRLTDIGKEGFHMMKPTKMVIAE